uniref:Putative LOV domain-containing protein n=1 Tax=Lygodium japonicum TaxID=13824 RepID=A0A126X0E1_LYGJA|nr:putative LOV domain-containing protein [Lygodium japonicum]
MTSKGELYRTREEARIHNLIRGCYCSASPAAAARRSFADCVMDSLSSTYKDSLKDALHKSQFNFVITDPRLPDNPIIFASDGFLHMTGYSTDEVLGRNCRFLQGPGTDRRTVLEIRDAIREERSCQVAILNYTKQGKPFWNLFHMAPVYSREDGRVVHFVGVQTPLSNQASKLGSANGPIQGVECYCPPTQAPEADSNLTAKNVDSIPVATSDGGDSADITEDDNCEVRQADREKAKVSVKSLLHELTNECTGGGITEIRCATAVARPGGEHFVCSSLMLSLTKVQQSFVLANPHLPDTPIVHASEMFLWLTGYSREEVVGRNCRFLQGPGTDQRAVKLIRESLNAEKSCTVRLLNYRKDKTPFWNLLHISPVRSNGGKVAFYVGVQLDVTSADVCEEDCVTPHMKQLGAVGAVRVAVRSLQGQGLRRVHKSQQSKE